MSAVEVAERIRVNAPTLTVAERRVAEVILAAPQQVGFGTVAELARAADVGAASVVRLAGKLGFDGYSDLQDAVRRELADQLGPAAERIRAAAAGARSEFGAIEQANVESTLRSVNDEALDALVSRMADIDAPVVIASGAATAGVARQFAAQVADLRPGVVWLDGNDIVVRREIALLPPNATAIVIDLRRYERWVLDAHATLGERGVWSAGVTDGPLSPVAACADVWFQVTAASSGPFDSHVGTLALLQLVVTEVARTRRTDAASRLDAMEQAWRRSGSLTDGRE